MAASKARMRVEEVLEQVLEQSDNNEEIEEPPTLSEVVERSLEEFKRLSRSIYVFSAFREEASASLQCVYRRYEINSSPREKVLCKSVKVGPIITAEVSI
jgi:hypothetical protein